MIINGPSENNQVYYVEFFEDTAIEDDFSSSIPCTNISVDEVIDRPILEIKQASNKACKTNLTNAIIKPENVFEKTLLE